MAKQQFVGNIRSAPVWLADFTGREHQALFPARIDPTQFVDAGGINVTVGANAAGNAVSITVAALALASYANSVVISSGVVVIPNGTTISFGGKKFATLTADAKLGDTTLTVSALATALVTGDVAVYSPLRTELIPSGTVVGRTFAQRDAGTSFGAVSVANLATYDELYLVAFDVVDASNFNDVELVRQGVRIKENYLPAYTAMSTAVSEVQTITIAGSMSGGLVGLGDGKGNKTNIAFNANLAAIQAGLDILYGATNTVAAGTIASFTVTFAVALANLAQTKMTVDTSGATGSTTSTVTQTTPGGTPILTKLRQLYSCFKGQD